MKDIEKYYDSIKKFLQRRDSRSVRRELYEWYNQQDEPFEISSEDFQEIGTSVRNQIFSKISSKKERDRSIRLLKWGSLTASILIIVGGLFWFNKNTDREATVIELSNIIPEDNQATITLPNGQVVHLDNIELGNKVEFGDIIIQKNEKGEISYTNLNPDDINGKMYVLQTSRSSTSEIVLSDGTKVLLNGGSKLYYPAKFEKGDRMVILEGEGYFQVVKSTSSSKFIVHGQGQKVEVLGTKFNIKAYKDLESVYTTLEEGKVVVSEAIKSDQKILLSPGYQSGFHKGRFSSREVELESVLSWTQGIFYFDGTNTEDVLAQIERWYDIDVTYSKGNTQYLGKIPRSLSLDKLIDLMSYAGFDIKPKINKENKINLHIN